MDLKAKVLLVAMIGAVVSTAEAELVWEKTELELRPALGDATAVAHFKYENKGDKPVAIKSVTSTCGCTAATAKQSAAPGEKGEVTATFTIGNRVGVQQKPITVVTDDPVKPNTTLTLKVAIPQLLEIYPTFVFWQAGEEAKPKIISAKGGAEAKIKSLDVTSSNPDFSTKVEAGSSPNEFNISVEPKQTTTAAAATLTIKPAVEKVPPKTFNAIARVMPPPPATTQKSNPAQPPIPLANQAPQPQPVANAGTIKNTIDACTLLTSKEIELVQGEPLKDVKSSGQSLGRYAISQCYFALPTSSNSISLTLTEKGEGADARDPNEQWKEIFHREHGEKKSEKEGESEEKEATPEKIEGIGDEAFWTGNRVGGELFVLKGDKYIRISVGGAGDYKSKMKKSKILAVAILKRLDKSAK